MLVTTDMSNRILDVAAQLVQMRGFNAFSYADIAADLGVTRASLHYHFPTKETLGERLIERYHDSFVAALDDIDRKHDVAGHKLLAYMAIYEDVLESGRMCLCGMLASDFATLPDSMKVRLQRFFLTNEVWLAKVLRAGRDGGDLDFLGQPTQMARFVVSTLEGGMLLARAQPDHAQFKSVVVRLLESLRLRKPKASARESRSR
jgi:TetR/AcrR family transcriptional repressor of nem operon